MIIADKALYGTDALLFKNKKGGKLI